MTDSKKNRYLTFLISTVVFFGIVFILDLTIGKTLKYFYYKQESGSQYRTTYSIEKTTADVLIFGSSRANHHYYPELFEDSLKMSYYNVGRDGNFIFYHYAVLKGILARHKPKIIILDFVKNEFKKNNESYERLSCLLPYYNSHPEMRSTIELKGPNEKVKLLSEIYPYNSSVITIAVGNSKSNKKRKSDYKGYVALNSSFKGSELNNDDKQDYEIDSVKINYFKSFIGECINSKIKILIVCSPYYYKSNYEDNSIVTAKRIAKSNNVRFYDFSKDSVFLGKNNLFADKNHLNDFGAQKFTKTLLDRINKEF